MDDIRKSDAMWELLPPEAKDAEKMDRPILTFFQDGCRRLKKNKVAMVSLFIILIITLTAIIVPFFWPYSYDQQDLSMANLPPSLDSFVLNDEMAIYVTAQYTVIELTPGGKLIKLTNPIRKDLIGKKNLYELNGKSLVVDYGIYSQALAEYKKLEQAVKKSGVDSVSPKGVRFLEAYYVKQGQSPETLPLEEALRILNNETAKVLVSYDNQPLTQKTTIRNQSYILGTDGLGRDLFIRLVYGARISLLVGFVAAILNFVIGVFYGGFAGYMGGRVDNLMMRFVDAIDSIPMTLYVILIMVIVGPGLVSIISALGLTLWVRMARIVRGQVLTLKNQEFVKAAVVMGADMKRIMVKHLIPNMMGPIMVAIAMQIPSAIFQEAFLSFVGLGIAAPQASWGTLCNDALAGIYVYPYQMFLPAIAISVTILTFNLLSDGLRDAFDPKLKS